MPWSRWTSLLRIHSQGAVWKTDSVACRISGIRELHAFRPCDVKCLDLTVMWFSNWIRRPPVLLVAVVFGVTLTVCLLGRKALPIQKKHHHRIANFILGGSQKAGTTAVADYLHRRHDVCRPNVGKEAHFLDHDELVAQGSVRYESLFEHCHAKTRILMDATPKYMLYAHNVHQIYQEAGMAESVKILFTLREPVSRELSWYHHLLFLNETDQNLDYAKEALLTDDGFVKSFETYALQNILPSIHDNNPWNRGLYAYWLQQWFDLFDRQQILILSYDDLQRDPVDFLQRLDAFLELPHPPKHKSALHQVNAMTLTNPVSIPCAIQDQLAAEYELPNQELYDLLEAHPGPAMESRPFPKFEYRCKE